MFAEQCLGQDFREDQQFLWNDGYHEPTFAKTKQIDEMDAIDKDRATSNFFHLLDS